MSGFEDIFISKIFHSYPNWNESIFEDWFVPIPINLKKSFKTKFGFFLENSFEKFQKKNNKICRDKKLIKEP